MLSWPGVTSDMHRFGGTEFRVNGREMGHSHESSLADLPFPMQVRDDLERAAREWPTTSCRSPAG